MEIVREWLDPPQMEPGAPLPALRSIGDRLLVAYVCSNPEFPGWESGAPPDHAGFEIYSAVVEFTGVRAYTFGLPNDEGLHRHPLYEAGLKFYAFNEVRDTPVSACSRWIVTFHDETLDVVADTAAVLHSRIDGEDTRRILESLA